MPLCKTLQSVNPNSITAVGLDVSKEKISLCFMTSSQSVFYEIGNNSQELNEFCVEMKNLWVKRTVPYILESTWDYHLLWAITLKEAWLNTKEINPIITHNYIKHTIRGTKTDKTDSEVLARIWVIEWEKLKSFDRSEEIIKLKKKVKLIASFEKQIQKAKASLSGFKKTFKTLGFEVDPSIIELENTIKALEWSVKNIQNEIEKCELSSSDSKKFETINTITWISKYMAKVFLIEFWSIDFGSKGAMLAYVGLDPKLKQSWMKNKWVWLSKRGSSYVRKKIYQAAFCSIQHSAYFKWIYTRAMTKWKHHFIAVLAVAKKMIHIMRSLLKYDTVFDENHENNNLNLAN